MAQFFISYRREDSAAEAGRLYDLLCQRFDSDAVFMDVDTLRPGVNYTGVIEQHLRENVRARFGPGTLHQPRRVRPQAGALNRVVRR